MRMYRRNKIRQWIADGEGPTLDFKQTITSAPKIARSIVAFANSRGGKIVVGIEDHGHIIGVDVGEEQYELEKAAKKYCEPAITLEFEEYEIHGKMLLIAYVEESDAKPHYAINKKGQRKIYVRIGDECVVPSPLIEELLQRGDMNYLQRNHAYTALKFEVFEYLKQHSEITVADFMALKKCSERSAKRTLLDFLFEGALRTKDGGLTYFI